MPFSLVPRPHKADINHIITTNVTPRGSLNNQSLRISHWRLHVGRVTNGDHDFNSTSGAQVLYDFLTLLRKPL